MINYEISNNSHGKRFYFAVPQPFILWVVSLYTYTKSIHVYVRGNCYQPKGQTNEDNVQTHCCHPHATKSKHTFANPTAKIDYTKTKTHSPKN